MNTGKARVDLYLLWAPQKIEKQYLDPQKRIFGPVRLGSVVYWFILLWEELWFCTFVSEFGLNLAKIFHKRKNGEKFEKLKFHLNKFAMKWSFWCFLMLKWTFSPKLLEISPFFLLLVSELKNTHYWYSQSRFFFQLRVWGLWNTSVNMPKEKLGCSKNIRQTFLVKKSHPSIWCVSFKMQIFIYWDEPSGGTSRQ